MSGAENSSALMKHRLRGDLKSAMQNRCAAEVKLLRVLIAALDNAEAVPVDLTASRDGVLTFGDGSAEVARKSLTAADVQSVLEREKAERQATAADLERLGETVAARTLIDEAELIGRYLAT